MNELAIASIQANSFQNVHWKLMVMLYQPQCVKLTSICSLQMGRSPSTQQNEPSPSVPICMVL